MTQVDPLFANHLLFFDTHRGEVVVGEDAVEIRGAIPALSSWTPLNEAAAVPEDAAAVRLVPASGEGWDERLAALGFERAECLTYMTAPSGRRAAADRLSIDVVADEDQARDFARVQAEGFEVDGAPSGAWWREQFVRVALGRYADPAHSFLLARVDGEPAATLLLLRSEGLGGIYAVATRPQARNQGLAGALLDAASDMAAREGLGQLVLQVAADSYTEGYYARRGFEARYRSQVWRRPAA